LIRHKVTDYPAWKRAFDEQGAIRWSHGCRGGQVFHNADDPGEMVILLTWDDARRARLYAQSDEWRESMNGAWIIDDPDIWVLEHTNDVAS
jgi:hypothetical protein